MSLPKGRFAHHVHDSLTQLLSRPKPPGKAPLAVFDWDNTCISGDIGEAVLERLDHNGHHPDAVRKYWELCETYDKTVGYKFCAETMGGMSVQQADDLVNDVIDEHLRSGAISLRPEMHQLMDRMRDTGWEVWVVTASAEPIVRTFAPRYGVPRTQVIGMALHERDGMIQPEMCGPITYRQGKVDAIDQRIGRRPNFAAGDALTDYEMLHTASDVLLFDRGNEELQLAAKKNGWLVQTPF